MKEIKFTCAVCPNGCSLSVVQEDRVITPKDTGRCIRGHLLMGRDFTFLKTNCPDEPYILVSFVKPLTKYEMTKLVKVRQKIQSQGENEAQSLQSILSACIL